VSVNFSRSGTGEPLVLIHGIGSRWQVWQPVLPRLVASRDVIAIDLPGFGASPAPPPDVAPGVESMTDLVVAFLDSLGLEAPHVAGNSLGGWLALELARRGRAGSATALSPAGFWNDAEAVFCRLSLITSFRAARLMAPRADTLLRPPLARAAAFRQLVRHPTRIPPGDAADTIRALGGAPWFEPSLTAMARERFRAGSVVSAPVTIAWGEHDWLLLRRQADRAARAIPHARMLTLSGCGHVPTYDDPDQVAGVLLVGSAL
jgi:pimeloyl-ACP methyl ester carboxylesterase